MAALTFPLAQAALGDILPVRIVDWELSVFQEMSMTNGEFQGKDLGRPLWTGMVTLRPLKHTDARAMAAKLRALDGILNTFYLANPLGWYPAADPRGTILGASVVTIDTIASNRKEISFIGLPDDYVISPGDFFSVSYAAGARRGLFQCVGGGTADSAGETPLIEVRPHIQSGILEGMTVQFAKPAAKVKLLPNTLETSMHSANRTVISFQVRQTLGTG